MRSRGPMQMATVRSKGLVVALLAVILCEARPVGAQANSAPVYNGGLADQLFSRNFTFSYQFGAACFTDPDADPLTYSALLADANPLPSWLSFGGPTRTFSGTTPNAEGTWNVRVTATDSHSATATADFVVQAKGSPPVLRVPLPRREAKVNTPFSYTFLADQFVDPDGDPLTYTTSSTPAWLAFDGPTRTYSGTAPGSTGHSSVVLRASDGIDGITSSSWDLSVVTNLTPVYNGGIEEHLVWTAGLPYQYQFGDTCFTDPEGQPLSYHAELRSGEDFSEYPEYAWIHFDEATRTFSGITGNNIGEDITAQIRASDGVRSGILLITITVVRGWYLEASAGAHGAITPSGSVHVAPGDSITFTITPEPKCCIADVLVDGASVGRVTEYAFTGIAADHTIAAGFELAAEAVPSLAEWGLAVLAVGLAAAGVSLLRRSKRLRADLPAA